MKKLNLLIIMFILIVSNIVYAVSNAPQNPSSLKEASWTDTVGESIVSPLMPTFDKIGQLIDWFFAIVYTLGFLILMTAYYVTLWYLGKFTLTLYQYYIKYKNLFDKVFRII